MNLYKRLNQVENWKYYNGNSCCGVIKEINNYKEAIENSNGFIESYFKSGAKSIFLSNGIYKKDKKRAMHVTNTYFLGLYLVENMGFLQPTSLFLRTNRHFLWAWFLCSLYHDAFCNDTVAPIDKVRYDYCKYSKGLLYSQTTIENYYKKNKTKETSYDNEIHYDHGIVAASKLYSNYMQILDNALQNNNQKIENFFNEQSILIEGNLHINYDTYVALCKVAKIIACHNIFVCDSNNEDDKDKYRKNKLSHLIVGNGKFHKMPNMSILSRDDYGKLYYLLALTDTLEPTKRGLDVNNIDIEVEKLDMSCEIILSNINDERYLSGINSLPKWLDCVDVKDNGKKLVLHDL